MMLMVDLKLIQIMICSTKSLTRVFSGIDCELHTHLFTKICKLSVFMHISVKNIQCFN